MRAYFVCGAREIRDLIDFIRLSFFLRFFLHFVAL